VATSAVQALIKLTMLDVIQVNHTLDGETKLADRIK
jgi:hypothetical protein